MPGINVRRGRLRASRATLDKRQSHRYKLSDTPDLLQLRTLDSGIRRMLRPSKVHYELPLALYGQRLWIWVGLPYEGVRYQGLLLK